MVTIASLLTEELSKSDVRHVFLLTVGFEWMQKEDSLGNSYRGISESRECIKAL